MKKISNILFIPLIFAVAIMGCEQQQITAFERGYSAVNFATDSLTYSFLGNDTGEYIQEITVDIMGDSTGYDRSFEVEVVDDEVTTAQKTDYKIMGGGIVKAGTFHGVLKVKLYNSNRLDSTQVALHLKLAESKDFKIGNVETDEVKLVWTNVIIVPEWTFYYTSYFCQYPSTTAYKAIVELTGYKKIDFALLVKIGDAALKALGKKFGDYVREYNATHNKPFTHADGPAAGEPVIPVY